MPRPHSPSAGFSLIEMAVLLVIIGITVATIMPQVISSQKKDFLIEQKRAVRNARNEVLGYYLNTGNCSSFPSALDTHLHDRGHLKIEYNRNATASLSITKLNGSAAVPVAFWVASRGQNRMADQCNSSAPINDYTSGATICLGLLEADALGFDDVIDYATVDAVDDLCGR